VGAFCKHESIWILRHPVGNRKRPRIEVPCLPNAGDAAARPALRLDDPHHGIDRGHDPTCLWPGLPDQVSDPRNSVNSVLAFCYKHSSVWNEAGFRVLRAHQEIHALPSYSPTQILDLTSKPAPNQ
jgi:hypothetical protein